MATSTTTKGAKASASKAGSAEAVDRRNLSAQANSGRVLNFGESLTEKAFASPSRWGQTLDQLYVGVRDGAAKLGQFYLVGEFISESGANTCRNDIKKNPARLIRGAFDLRSRTVDPATHNGYKSQLWAALTRLDEEGDAEPDADAEPGAEGGDEAGKDWE